MNTGIPRGYGEQKSLLFLLMGACEHDQNFQGNLGIKWIQGSNLEFFKGTVKKILGIREFLEMFLRNTGTQEHSPPGRPSILMLH